MKSMGKAIAALVVVALALIVGTGLALANNGPHGAYTRYQTSGCAGCHRAHTSTDAGGTLLTDSNVYDLCISCHGGGSAATNVLQGTGGGGARLNGGGFEFMGGVAATSAHRVEGLNGGTGQDTAWGGASSGTGVTGVLECTSCHNPHGSTNYRLLKDADNGHGTAWTFRWAAGDTITDTQTLDWQNNQVVATDSDAYNYVAGTNANYTGGMSAWCASCHKQYLTGSGSSSHASTDSSFYAYPGTQDANDGKGDVARYRHVTSRLYTNITGKNLRFAASFASATTRAQFTCLTCHFAHGTTATATGFAAGVAPTNDSALLYYNNRGVCRECHQTAK